ncbi:MAG: hypothetical protein HC912_05885 [Saprospiraceae bacterium]|nr:hypothetical protein [Saprospiraceae bacterium]
MMVWSAWPTETNSQCFVKHTDGVVGAQTVYAKNGKEFGYQEITHLKENEKVTFVLKSYVAPFEKDVRLSFILKELPNNETEINMWFSELLKKPHFFGSLLWRHYQMGIPYAPERPCKPEKICRTKMKSFEDEQVIG